MQGVQGRAVKIILGEKFIDDKSALEPLKTESPVVRLRMPYPIYSPNTNFSLCNLQDIATTTYPATPWTTKRVTTLTMRTPMQTQLIYKFLKVGHISKLILSKLNISNSCSISYIFWVKRIDCTLRQLSCTLLRQQV